MRTISQYESVQQYVVNAIDKRKGNQTWFTKTFPFHVNMMMMMPGKLILMLFILNIESNENQAYFKLYPIGYLFNPITPSDHLIHYNLTHSLIHCVSRCAMDIRCRTVNFDSSIHQCSLFSAWNFEGNISSSVSSQIAFIEYQPCNTSYNLTHQNMQCVNGVWICLNGYFFHGNVCEHQRPFNQSCQSDEWCDSSLDLICSNWSGRCRCNSSMRWTGSQCNFSKYHFHLFFINHFLSPFSLSNRSIRYQFRRSHRTNEYSLRIR